MKHTFHEDKCVFKDTIINLFTIKKSELKLSQDILPPILYTFLDYALDAEVEKTIIDCGAGGNFPKIALYAMSGFDTYGIEISE